MEIKGTSHAMDKLTETLPFEVEQYFSSR